VRKLISFPLVATAAVALGLLGSVSSASADGGMPVGTAKAASFTIWEHDDYEGGGASWTSDVANLANWCWGGGGACRIIDNNASSMSNGTGSCVVMYANANYSGVPYTALPHSSDSDLTNNHFDNTASSINMNVSC
jgi:peptidase inhibitor family I36